MPIGENVSFSLSMEEGRGIHTNVRLGLSRFGTRWSIVGPLLSSNQRPQTTIKSSTNQHQAPPTGLTLPTTNHRLCPDAFV